MNTIGMKLLLISLVGSLGSCSWFKEPPQPLVQSSPVDVDGSLTFQDVTLEQSDEEGRLLWKVKASQARYSQDQKTARITNPSGELFQDGKLVFRMKAKTGEVQQDGQRIILQEDIVATDTQDGAVLKGKELEWRPQEDVLIVRNNLTGTHPQMKATAQEARVFSRARRMELSGSVTAKTTDPALQLKTEHLVWHIAQHLVVSDRPLEVQRFLSQGQTEQAKADQGEVNLKTKVATLKQNANLTLTQPPLQVTSNSLAWNLKSQTVRSEQPIRVVHRQEQVDLQANQGLMDLNQKVVYLTGNVDAVSQNNKARINSDQLTWYVPTQSISATGNVVYRQSNPPFKLTGPQAFGKLQDQTVVVSGGRVVTEFVP